VRRAYLPYGSMSVALGLGVTDCELAEPATTTAAGAAELAAITVKPKALASSPKLATATPARVRMTFIVQPFRLLPMREPRTHVPPRGRR
jgi:hypothetical protein